MQQGSLGLGESYMDGWWECDQLDEFIARLLHIDIESLVSSNIKDLFRVVSARIVICSRENARGSSAKSITI